MKIDKYQNKKRNRNGNNYYFPEYRGKVEAWIFYANPNEQRQGCQGSSQWHLTWAQLNVLSQAIKTKQNKTKKDGSGRGRERGGDE
jgi:hypothetical protein